MRLRDGQPQPHIMAELVLSIRRPPRQVGLVRLYVVQAALWQADSSYFQSLVPAMNHRHKVQIVLQLYLHQSWAIASTPSTVAGVP